MNRPFGKGQYIEMADTDVTVIDLTIPDADNRRTDSYKSSLIQETVSDLFNNDDIRSEVMKDMELSDTMSITAALCSLLTRSSDKRLSSMLIMRKYDVRL